ncbi:MAG: hypothetical protein J5I94_02115 [Phaeodactylibacter sp.]|nr:hypothetical protein [Phaeodactylibacter sp.]
MHDPVKNRWVQAGIFIAFAIAFTFFKFRYHELWKDEWQAWLLSRDQSLWALLSTLYFEGHPALWYLYLKLWAPFSGLAADDVLIQLAHLPVALAGLAALFFRQRYPWWLRIAVLFTYFTCFEYGIVSRGYAFVLLLGAVCCAWAPEYRERPWPLAVALFLLCQTEVYAVLMAAALYLYLVYPQLASRNWRALWENLPLRRVGLALFFGVAAFLLTVFPRSGERNIQAAFVEPFSQEAIAKTFQGAFANTYLIGAIPDTNVFGVNTLGLGLSVLVAIILGLFFLPNRRVLFTFTFFTVGFLLFGFAFYAGGVRQWGMYFVFFLFSLQLYLVEKGRFSRFQIGVLAIILLFQARYNAMALYKEYHHPFSNARQAGLFIREKVPENVPVVAINKFEAAPVGGYAGRQFYFLPDGERFSFFKWTEKIYLPPEQELFLFAEYKNVGGLVILTNRPLGKARYPRAVLWKSFDRYNLKGENYYLYTLQR